MNHRTWIPFLAVSSIALASCEQQDDQALIKIYEVVQRDMQARDESQKSALDGLHEQLQTVTRELETLKKGLTDISGPESNEKLASIVAEAVAKKIAEQNAEAIAELQKQIETVKSTSAALQSEEKVPGPNGTSYRQNPPAPEPVRIPTRESNPSRERIRIDF